VLEEEDTGLVAEDNLDYTAVGPDHTLTLKAGCNLAVEAVVEDAGCNFPVEAGCNLSLVLVGRSWPYGWSTRTVGESLIET